MRSGAISGLAAGLAGALVLWLLVEPTLEQAIALEEAVAHEHAAAAVSRGQQIVAGLITVIVVGLLSGLIFSIIYSWTRDRLPGSHDFGKSMVLAGLSFVVLALGPALVVPANPPGVGEAATVTDRTQIYLLTLFLLIVLVVGCVKVVQGGGSVALRGTAVTVLVVVGVILLMVAVSDSGDGVPDGFPAGLLWDFRVASLAQHAIMWLTTGVVFGWTISPSRAAQQGLRRPAPDTGR